MAELDAATAAALCRPLEKVLALELGVSVRCSDVSSRSERWDIEARDESGVLVRRVSYTQTVVSRMARAEAELRDIRDALEQELATLGVVGQGVSLHGRTFPKSRRQREVLGRALAERIRDHLQHGIPIIEDPLLVLQRGEDPREDEIARSFAYVEVSSTKPTDPSKVLVSGDDRLGYRVPELHEEILPAILEKKARHKELTPQLTLVVEPTLTRVLPTDVRRVKALLEESHRGFASVCAAERVQDGPGSLSFQLERIY